MSFQYNIEDMKIFKINEFVQNPVVITLYLLLLAPVYAYTIFHSAEILRSIITDDLNYKFIKLVIILCIGFISICTAIKVAIGVADKSYNITKNLYTMFGCNNLSLFDNIFYIIFFGSYIILFALVMLLPINISLFATIVYILCNE
jgi:hypothetical protein